LPGAARWSINYFKEIGKMHRALNPYLFFGAITRVYEKRSVMRGMV